MALEIIKSERTIAALRVGTKRLNDGGGLYLLPFAADGGGHYWRFDYSFEHKRKTLSLGVHPNVTLTQARTLAAKARLDISTGVDPSNLRKANRQHALERHQEAQRTRSGLPKIRSFEEVMRRWFAVKSENWIESYSSKVIRRIEMHLLPKLGQLQMSEIRPIDVLDACREVERQDSLETAHRIRGLCSSVFRFAIAEGADLRDPCSDIKDALKRPIVQHYAAITKPAPLAVLLTAIYSYEGSLVVRSALKLSTMLMTRPGELRLARWEEFDLTNGLWYIPSSRMKRTKANKTNGQPHFVPLPRQAVEILEELFKATGNCDKLFPAERRADKFISENTLNKALQAIGYGKGIATAHGFRATARTLAVELLQFPESVVEAQLAHDVKDLLGRAYNRTEFIQMRIELMQAWADYLTDLRNGKSVVQHPVLPTFTPVTKRNLAHC